MSNQCAPQGKEATYSPEALAHLVVELATIGPARTRLVEAIVARKYKSRQATDHAQRGFARRIGTLARCIENSFAILPPDFQGLPDSDRLADATIQIQAFVFNLVGALDNLAWMWVLEAGITQRNGKPLPNQRVGLRRGHKCVRESFSSSTQEYLMSFDNWFDYVEDFRHALAHRIPFYIPPYTVSNSDTAAYRQSQEDQWKALGQGNWDAYIAAQSTQESLSVFVPWITNQSDQDHKSVYIHPQILTDFKTVVDIAWTILSALDCPSQASETSSCQVAALAPK
jgi:hypothetical protein